jgi:hypothetical protein
LDGFKLVLGEVSIKKLNYFCILGKQTSPKKKLIKIERGQFYCEKTLQYTESID